MTAGRGEEDRGDSLQSLRIAVKQLQQKLARTSRVGTVVETDYAKGKVKVKIGGNTTAWIPWTQPRAGGDNSWWAPEKEEQVLIHAPGGDLSQAVISGSIYQNKFPQPHNNEKVQKTTYKDGTVETHDREKKARTLAIPAGGSFTINVGSASIHMTEDACKITVGGTELTLEPGGTTLKSPQFTGVQS